MPIETLAAHNAVSAAPQTAASIANAGVNSIAGFLGTLAGPAIGLVAAYWGIKTIVGKPPKFIKNIVG